MEILSCFVGKLVDYTIEPIGRQLGYLCFIRRNIQNLKSQVETLKDTRESVRHQVSEAIRNAENIESGVENWLTKVDALIQKSEAIITLVDQPRLCLNLVQRHKLSRKAVKMAVEVLDIKNEGNFDRVSYRVPLSQFESSQAKSSDFLDFESRKSTTRNIIDSLMDDHVNRIGVYGMGGVGKTMLVKEISRMVMEKKLFDEVVTISISQTPDLRRIQGQLSDKLGLKLELETEEGRALQLQKRLKISEKRILIVLDDVWNEIDLESIGLSTSSTIEEDQTRCKILFTSRDNHVLSNDLRTDKNFEIKVLRDEEAWNLFKKMAGEIVEKPEWKDIAVEVLSECAHLPIAIAVVAKALGNKQPSIWKDALRQLKDPVVGDIRGMDQKVYSSMKLSYDQLKCEDAKLLFLLCSMFPEDGLIDVKVLHVYAMGMGFLHGVDTVAEARDRIAKLIFDDLISSSLLILEEGMFVKMHDIIRDVAILISSKNDRIRTLSYLKGLDESWQEKKVSGDHTAVYLKVQGFHNNLPQKLMLPKVQLLVLGGTSWYDLLEIISETFFEEMKELKVVELHSIKISQLTPLLQYSFATIKSLNLDGCEFENIDMIGELRCLEFLSLKRTKIIQIPVTLRQLTQLKVLDLTYCNYLKVIPPNVLLNLTKLEELYLETFNEWEGEELNEGRRRRRNANLSELTYLSSLQALTLWIPDETIIPKQLFSRLGLNLEKFDISIGFKNENPSIKRSGISKSLCYLKMDSGSCKNNNEIKMLLKKCEALYLEGSVDAKVLNFELINENNSSHLKHLCIRDNLEFQHLIHEQNKPLEKVFSNLEHLKLKNLKNLESIFHIGRVREALFNKLKVIKLYKCNKLESFFFSSSLDDLSHLEKIKIVDCEMMKSIILMRSEKATDKIVFTNLKSIQLVGLPRLESFSSKIGQPSNNDGTFFDAQASFPNLEELVIEGVDKMKMICHNELILNSFSKLESVEISRCNNLEKVFPSNILSILTCLGWLRIEKCKLLEGVFEVKEPNVTEKSFDLLPNLIELKLKELPNLKYIWNKDYCELVNLKSIILLSIEQCSQLKRDYPINVLRRLKQLKMSLCELKEILRKDKTVQASGLNQPETSKSETIQLWDARELLPELRDLELYGSFDRRLTHLPMEILPLLRNLRTFELGRTLIEEVFPIERLGINVEERQNETATSNKLETLRLYELPKLRHFWNEVEDLQKNSSLLHNLDELTMTECGILNMLVPSSSMSFTNLTWLQVERCHNLTFLLNPSVARTLVQLRYLFLTECKRMTTVIAGGGGGAEEENDEIIFKKLYRLELKDLSELIRFHSGKCIIRFPHLETVRITNCPEMKDFSLGVVSTPKLYVEDILSYDDHADEFVPILKDSKDTTIVEDINVIIRQAWEENNDTHIQNLFEERTTEQSQSE